MADPNLSLPVRTENPGDVIVKLADSITPTQQLAIDAAGKVGVKLSDAAGNGITSETQTAKQVLDVGICVGGAQIDPRQVRALTAATDTVVANQGLKGAIGNAWPVQPTDGTNSQAYLASGEAKVSVTQPLPAGTNTIGKVAQDNTVQWLVQDLSDGSASGGTAAALSSLAGGIFNTALPTLTNGQQASLQLDASGRLIIRPLTSADIVTSAQGAPNTAANAWPMKITDGTNTAAVKAASTAAAATDPSLVVALSPNSPLPAGTNAIGTVKAQLQDNAGAAVTLGQKAMAASLPVVIASDQSPIPVSISLDNPGVEVNDYNTGSAIAAAATSNHDYTVSSGKTLLLSQIEGTGSGKMKIEVQIETAAASGTFVTKFVKFNSVADTNISITLKAPISVVTGARVRLIRTNRDNQAQDLYSTISGNEV